MGCWVRQGIGWDGVLGGMKCWEGCVVRLGGMGCLVGLDVLLGGIGQQLYTIHIEAFSYFQKKRVTHWHKLTKFFYVEFYIYLVYLFYSIFIWLIHFTFTYLMKGRLQKSEDIFHKGSLGQFNFLNFPHFLFFIKVFLTDWLCWLFCCYHVYCCLFIFYMPCCRKWRLLWALKGKEGLILEKQLCF